MAGPTASMVRALLLAALAALLAGAPGAAPGPQAHQGRAVRAAEYEAEYVDDDVGSDEQEEDDEDDYASSGEHGDDVEQPGDKPVPLAAPRRGRHVRHHQHVVDGSSVHRAGVRPGPDLANKAVTEARRVLFEDSSAFPGSCPPVPPSSLGGAGRCRAPRCVLDSDCGASRRPAAAQDDDRRCCFNGCVHTCLRVADPPLVVDWEDETPDVLRPEVPPVAEVPWQDRPRLQYNHGAREVVVLPGGCTLPPAQHQSIMAFMKGVGVKKCTCSAGAVVCRVT